MAVVLVPVISVNDNSAILSLSVDDILNRVVGIQLVNNSGLTVEIEVTRPSGQVLAVSRGAGTFVQSIPSGKRFTYADEVLADWTVSMTMVT